MSGNPFKLFDAVNKDCDVDKLTTEIIYYDEKDNKKRIYDKDTLKWDEHEELEHLSPQSVLNQIMIKEGLIRTPLIEIICETALWGVIFVPKDDI